MPRTVILLDVEQVNGAVNPAMIDRSLQPTLDHAAMVTGDGSEGAARDGAQSL